MEYDWNLLLSFPCNFPIFRLVHPIVSNHLVLLAFQALRVNPLHWTFQLEVHVERH